MSISYRAFIHPEDEAARRHLEAIPGFAMVTKYFLELGIEQFLLGTLMARHIRLSPTQLPHIYAKLPPICKQFDIPEPMFFLEMNPVPNAYTMGDKQTFIVVTSGLLEHLNEEEVSAVIAHECGHIVCRHVFYNTMTNFVLKAADMLGFIGKLIAPIQLGLLYWSRRSELSADRAELIYTGNIDTAIGATIRLAGGPYSLTKDVNIQEYSEQAKYYLDIQEKSKWHKLLQSYAIMNSTHPFSAVRVQELLKWEKTEDYQHLKDHFAQAKVYRHCSQCSQHIGEDQKFCRYCGNKTTEEFMQKEMQ